MYAKVLVIMKLGNWGIGAGTARPSKFVWSAGEIITKI